MDIGWKFSIQTNTVIVHDALRIFDDNADARDAIVSAFHIHYVEDVLFTPISLRRKYTERKIHQYVGQTNPTHKISKLSGKIDFPFEKENRKSRKL
jgi:hypothetical protein